jgi:large subunit ribosomal protein L17
MKHSISKIKIKSGKDANTMLVKKLLFNFVANGKITTTEKKAKVLKTSLEKVLGHTKEKTEANKNYLLRYFPQPKMINLLFDQVGAALKDKAGGYVKVTRLQERASDGAMMCSVSWAHPVVIEAEKTPEKKEHKAAKKASKTQEAKKQA